MRIPVDSIDDRGREVRVGLGEAWAVRAADSALETPPEALAALLRLERQGPVVFVRGKVETTATSLCDRCGEAVKVVVDHEVDLAYAPEQGGTGEVQLSEGDLDTGTYRDDVLDLSDVLAESITLGLPSRILCTDSVACDARTQALLGEPAGESTSPFAALAGLVRDH